MLSVDVPASLDRLHAPDVPLSPVELREQIESLLLLRRRSLSQPEHMDPELADVSADAPPGAGGAGPCFDEDEPIAASGAAWLPASVHPTLSPEKYRDYLQSGELAETGPNSPFFRRASRARSQIERKKSMLAREIRPYPDDDDIYDGIVVDAVSPTSSRRYNSGSRKMSSSRRRIPSGPATSGAFRSLSDEGYFVPERSSDPGVAGAGADWASLARRGESHTRLGSLTEEGGATAHESSLTDGPSPILASSDAPPASRRKHTLSEAEINQITEMYSQRASDASTASTDSGDTRRTSEASDPGVSSASSDVSATSVPSVSSAKTERPQGGDQAQLDLVQRVTLVEGKVEGEIELVAEESDLQSCTQLNDDAQPTLDTQPPLSQLEVEVRPASPEKAHPPAMPHTPPNAPPQTPPRPQITIDTASSDKDLPKSPETSTKKKSGWARLLSAASPSPPSTGSKGENVLRKLKKKESKKSPVAVPSAAAPAPVAGPAPVASPPSSSGNGIRNFFKRKQEVAPATTATASVNVPVPVPAPKPTATAVLTPDGHYVLLNRLPIHVERAIYRLSHMKLANPRRALLEQVLISNLMFWYLSVINSPGAMGNAVTASQEGPLSARIHGRDEYVAEGADHLSQYSTQPSQYGSQPPQYTSTKEAEARPPLMRQQQYITPPSSPQESASPKTQRTPPPIIPIQTKPHVPQYIPSPAPSPPQQYNSHPNPPVSALSPSISPSFSPRQPHSADSPAHATSPVPVQPVLVPGIPRNGNVSGSLVPVAVSAEVAADSRHKRSSSGFEGDIIDSYSNADEKKVSTDTISLDGMRQRLIRTPPRSRSLAHRQMKSEVVSLKQQAPRGYGQHQHSLSHGSPDRRNISF